jgi:alanyl-tRNA synthetase
MQETVAAADRVVAERDAHFKMARAGIEKLAEVEARALVQSTQPGGDSLRVVARVIDGLPLEYAQSFAREIAKAEKSVALVARNECGSIFFSQHPTARKDMNALLGAALKEMGGKGGGSRDAARGRVAEPQRARELLNLAEERIRRAE